MADNDLEQHDNNEPRAETLLLPGSDNVRLEPSNLPTFTYRSIMVGLLIGIITCLSNVYFGLQTGFGNTMAMASSLLGFALFRPFASVLKVPFGPKENVLIQTVAGATASMPITAGLISVIVALESVLTPLEGGPMYFTYLDLVIWALGLSFSGTFLAMLLRVHVLQQQNMPFPSATATAAIIKTLHREKFTPHDGPDLEPHERLPNIQHNLNDDPESIIAGINLADTPRLPPNSVRDVSLAIAVSGALTFVETFLPVLHNFPIFGNYLAQEWLWTLNLSAGLFGQGMLTGPVITLHMLFGTIVGWALLSPIAKQNGWAPGDVSDWVSGSRGWVLWVALSVLLADGLVNLLAVVFTLEAVLSKMRAAGNRVGKVYNQSLCHVTDETHSVTSEDSGSDSISASHSLSRYDHPGYDPTKKLPGFSLKQTYWILVGSICISAFLCTGTTRFVFGEELSISVIFFAVAISLLLGFMSIRAVGQTDSSPVSSLGKLPQFAFALIISKSNPKRLIINLAVGAIGEAGAMQSMELMFDLKTGCLLGADPFAQMSAHMIGSFFGAFLSAWFYKLYRNAYEIPGPLFQAPQAYIWLAAARLAYGDGLPKYSFTFSAAFALVAIFTTMLKVVFSGSKWQKFVPGGLAFAIGMYNVPALTLPRVLGGIAHWTLHTRLGLDATTLKLVAAGFILGETIFSLTGLLIAPLK